MIKVARTVLIGIVVWLALGVVVVAVFAALSDRRRRPGGSSPSSGPAASVSPIDRRPSAPVIPIGAARRGGRGPGGAA